MKTSLGIWALGPMVTRFVPGGYQPENAGETTAQRVERAVAGLGDLIDDYEFHYPQELSRENLDEVREALDGHGIYAIAGGLHVDEKDLSELDVRIAPRGVSSWRMRMSRPGGGNVRVDPATNAMEVEDVILIVGYQWR